MKQSDRDRLSELAKRRGFFWPSYEIYGGVGGFIDFGPYGASMKRKLEEAWLDYFVRRESFFFVQTPIIAPSPVFEASGHVTHFTDPITTCGKCGRKWRADHLLEEQRGVSGEGLTLEQLGEALRREDIRCLECKGELGDPQSFNELFSTVIGPYAGDVGYSRPETAQGMFINFRRLYELARNKLPFGVAQIGRCMRNEISPRQGPIRLRELTIMELELFFDPDDPGCERIKEVESEKVRLLPEALLEKGVKQPTEVTVKEALEKGYIKNIWNAYFMALAKKFLVRLGVPEEKQYFRAKLPSEKAHYSAQTYDQMVELERWGWIEVSGHAWRTDYDLKTHMVHSGIDMRIFKKYEHPKKQNKVIVKPRKDAISSAFGEKASIVTRLIEVTDQETIKRTLEDEGSITLRDDCQCYKLLPEHVEIEEKTVEEDGKRLIPHVAEPSFGVDRLLYATCEYAYSEREGRVVMRIPRELVPVQIAVFPLVTKDGLPEKADRVRETLSRDGYIVEHDESGSIGKRYARADEIGIPLTVTVDYQTLEDDTVTVRDRDSWRQVRTSIKKLSSRVREYFRYEAEFEQLGVPLKRS